MINKDKSLYVYTALFCEENIWHLCQSLLQQAVNHNHLHVLFISNPLQQVAIFNQKTTHHNTANDAPVVWDYHVILLRTVDNQQALVYDFDSFCEFPCKATKYFQQSFPAKYQINKDYRAAFRVINAKDYLNNFSSDRSHMQGTINDEQYPDYPAIEAIDIQQQLNFSQLINFNQKLHTNETFYSLPALFDKFQLD